MHYFGTFKEWVVVMSITAVTIFILTGIQKITGWDIEFINGVVTGFVYLATWDHIDKKNKKL